MFSSEEVHDLLKDRNLKKVSDASGVNYNTLTRWMRGDNPDPKYSMIKRLSNYLIATGLEECPHCRDAKES